MGTISVSNLSKAYKKYPTKWSRMVEWLDPTGKPRHQLKLVLENINFTVNAGDAVGIVGVNGAGKSTLLKLITGTTQPTTGQVRIAGRVAAMLELGMGFHPDFTGRQNVYMAGQILGIATQQVTTVMPEIEAFAEIGEYIDQPVRIYSSGMQMRLAFSIATAIRPDVLIVDEALSVGDTYFQHKSFERIREFRKLGTTLLIVSHDKSAIQGICDRAILLADGKIAMEGDPEVVMDYYNAMLSDKQNQEIKQIKGGNGVIQTISGSGLVAIKSIQLLNFVGKPVELIRIGEALRLVVRFVALEPIPNLTIGFMIKDRLGQVVFGTNTFHLDHPITINTAMIEMQCNFLFNCNIGVGSYSIAIALHSGESHVMQNYEWRDLAVLFNVVNADQPISVGTNWLPVTVEGLYK